MIEILLLCAIMSDVKLATPTYFGGKQQNNTDGPTYYAPSLRGKNVSQQEAYDYYLNQGLTPKSNELKSYLNLMDKQSLTSQLQSTSAWNFNNQPQNAAGSGIWAGTPNNNTNNQNTVSTKDISNVVSTYKYSNDPSSYIVNYLMKKGLTKQAASGIAGNLHEESGFSTTKVGDNGTSYGIAQWHAGRWDALKQYANQTGGSVSNINTQLDFLVHELNTSKSGVLSAINSSKTPEEAARNFAYNFERMKSYNIGREINARKFYNA